MEASKLLSDVGLILAGEFPLDHLPLIIGRRPDADIRVTDRWASRCHCEIAESNGALVVRDLGSSHGTLLNGHFITESSLTPGDRLTVGLTTFFVCGKDHNLDSPGAGPTLVLRNTSAEFHGAELTMQKPR